MRSDEPIGFVDGVWRSERYGLTSSWCCTCYVKSAAGIDRLQQMVLPTEKEAQKMCEKLNAQDQRGTHYSW